MIKFGAEENSCDKCSTKDCFIKQFCSDEYITLISNLKETSTYRKNQYIAHEGSAVLGLFFIKKGKAKVISAGLGGKTQVVRLTQKGGIIGHRGYGGEKYPISAIAIQESSICFINNDTIYKTFIDNPVLTYELMMYYSKELRKSESKIKSQAQMNVREKVVDALLSCNSIFNIDSIYPFLIPLTRQDIADLAGINTEQLSRVITELKKDDFILVSKTEISISNHKSLKEIIAPFGIVE